MINTFYTTYLLPPLSFNTTLRINITFIGTTIDGSNSYYNKVCDQSPILNEKQGTDYQREILYPCFIVEFDDGNNKETIWSIKIVVIIFYTEINNYW